MSKRFLPRQPSDLSESEQNILLMMALGYSNKQIANYLNINVDIVEGHRVELCRKLQIGNPGPLENMLEIAVGLGRASADHSR